MKLLLAILVFVFVACSMPERHGYDRSSGTYSSSKKSTAKKTPKKKEVVEETSVASAEKEQKATKAKSAKKESPKSSKKVVSDAWEKAYKPWLGTPYKYGGTTKKGVDCSGFVGNMYREVLGLQLPRTSSAMYDSGKKVSKENLKEGDLVFFGSFWKVDHVGIYLNGDRFVHASSSKGVMVSPMNDAYWKPKYQGARRYK